MIGYGSQVYTLAPGESCKMETHKETTMYVVCEKIEPESVDLKIDDDPRPVTLRMP